MPENFPLKTLSVFFPAYNEEDNIVNTVSKAINVLQSLNISDYEIIVVDDGSTDRTAAEVQNLAIKNSKIRLIRHNRNRGYGAALKTGFSAAKFDWIAFTDSDGQFDFREINKFLVNVTDFQVIVGYRRKRSDSKFRRMMAVLLRIWDTILFGLKLRDVDCGFKLIKKSVINKIFPLVTESAITETEMMVKIHRFDFPIKQIGVAHNSRIEGVQTGGNFKVIFKAVIESLKLFLHFNPFFSILIVILLVAAFLRLYLIRDYIVFLGDEGRDALVWHNMVEKGEFTFLGPTASVGGFYLGPIYYYLALPFYFIFRDPVGPAIFVALLGVVTVWLIYSVTKSWFGGTSGLFASGIYAVSSLIVRYSRASWNPNPVPFFSMLGIYLAATGAKEKKWWKLIGAGICLGILWQLHYLTLIMTPIIICVVIISNISKSSVLTEQGRALISIFTGFGFLFVGWAIGLSPFLAFEIYHHFPNTKTVLEFISRPNGSVFNWELLGLVRSVLRNTNRLTITIFSWQSGLATTIITSIWAFGGSLMIMLNKKNSPEKLILQKALLCWFWIGITIFSLYQGSISDYYFGFLFPIPAIFFGIVLGHLFEKKLFGRLLAGFASLWLVYDQSGHLFLQNEPNRLLQQTESVSRQVISMSGNEPYNFALITSGNSDHAYRYFLEKLNQPPVRLQDLVASQLIAVCEKSVDDCQPLGNPIWEIAGFGRAEVVDLKTIPPGITIYRLTHYFGPL